MSIVGSRPEDVKIVNKYYSEEEKDFERITGGGLSRKYF